MVDSCWENERLILGLGWLVPPLLIKPRWSTASGEPLHLPTPPSESVGWSVDINPSTDAEGWQYASVFKHFDYTRPGGRAGKRAGDFVRRRRWRRNEQAGATQAQPGSQLEGGAAQVAAAAETVATSLVSPVTQMQGSRVRKQTEVERRKTAMRVFMNMLTATVKRRQLWTMMPFDPVAWVVLLQKHQADLEAHQALQKASAPSALPPLQPAAGVAADTGQDGNLLRDLLCAAMHSRAAYGFAMSAGHLSSIMKFAFLHTVHQLSFDAAGGASGTANNEAVAALAGIPLVDLRMSEWSNSIMRPCHYVAVDRANHCIVISIRGSLEVGDVLSDLTANPLELFGLVGVEGLAHEGMMAAATYVQCNTAPALEALARELPGWPLFLTGHSMGGGVATILALLMKEGAAPKGLGPIKCIVVGPAPVLSRPLAEACNSFVTSVILGADVVPRVSYASVEIAFLELVNASPVRTVAANLAAAGHKVTEGIKGLNAGINAGLKATLKPSAKPSASGLPGLRGILSLPEDEAAAEAAAHVAEAASLGEGGVFQDNRSIGSLDHGQPSSSARSEQIALQDSQNFADSSAYTISGVSSSVAEAAAARLAFLQAESIAHTSRQNQHRVEGDGQIGNSASGASMDRGSDEGPAMPVGTGSRAGADYETAGEVLGANKKEFQDASGHPEPLYVGGRVLWMIAADDASTSGGATSTSTGASPEVEMVPPPRIDDDLPACIDQLHADDITWINSRKASLASVGTASGSRYPGSTRLVPAGNEVGGQLASKEQSASVADMLLDACEGPSGRKDDRVSQEATGFTDASREFPSLAVTEEFASRVRVQGAQQAERSNGGNLSGSGEPDMGRSKRGMSERSINSEGGADVLAAGSCTHKPKKARSGDQRSPERKGPAVLEVPRETFDRILLTMEMITDHLPDSYLAAVQQL